MLISGNITYVTIKEGNSQEMEAILGHLSWII